MAASSSIPVIDMGALLLEPPPPAHVRTQLVRQIVGACETWGFLQLVNHAVPLDLIDNIFAMSQQFFTLPYIQKKAVAPPGAAPVRTGFIDDDLHQGHSVHRERLAFFFGDDLSAYNVWPATPALMREVVEAYMVKARKVCALVLEVLAEGLGVTLDDVLDTSDDFLALICYPPSTNKAGEMGAGEHTDGNTLTLLLQDDVGGLEVLKDGQWISVPPIKGAIVINVGDVLQVWSNLKYKSVIHRVTNHPSRPRYSVPFFSSPPPFAMVKPFRQCTTDIGEPPKYRAFEFREYMLHRFKNTKSTLVDAPNIQINYYAI